MRLLCRERGRREGGREGKEEGERRRGVGGEGVRSGVEWGVNGVE